MLMETALCGNFPVLIALLVLKLHFLFVAKSEAGLNTIVFMHNPPKIFQLPENEKIRASLSRLEFLP